MRAHSTEDVYVLANGGWWAVSMSWEDKEFRKAETAEAEEQ